MVATLKRAAGRPLDPMVSLEREILNRFVTHQFDYTDTAKTTFKRDSTGKEDFLSEHKLCGEKVEGDKCLRLLSNCLTDNINCVANWNSLNWASGVDFKDADHGAAVKLAKKLGLDTKSVDDVFKDIQKLNKHITLTESVKVALKSLQEFVNPHVIPSIRSVTGTSSTLNTVQKRTGTIPMVLYPSLKMSGGGIIKSNDLESNICKANYKRCMNNLDFQMSMKGGGSSTGLPLMLRATLSELQSILKSNGKEIEQNDLARINDAIDSAERSTKRVEQLGMFLVSLNIALKESKIDIKSQPAKVTLRIIEDLVEKQNQTTQVVQTKITSLYDIFKNLETLTKDITEIKSKI